MSAPHRRTPYRQLSEFERGYIAGARDAGLSWNEIERRIGRDSHTIRSAYQAWVDEGRTSALPRSGRPRRSSQREDRVLVRASTSSRTSPATALAREWSPAIHRGVSVRTIRRRLQEAGLSARRTLQRIPLTRQHRQARLQWCRARRDWRSEWHHIVFSDESRFCLEAGDARILVRRRRGERLHEACVQTCPSARQRSVLVWGAISYEGRSSLLRVQGTLTSARYIAEILQPEVVPLIHRLRGATFQQDNARPHTAATVRAFLTREHIPVLPWPACSPDLNPIEHVWDIIGRRLRQYAHAPANDEELWQRINVEWTAVPQNTIQHLVDSLPRRVAAVLKAAGGYTRY